MVFNKIFLLWALVLNQLNFIPMVRNLLVPLYQDSSLLGRFISVVIRTAWIIVTGSLLLCITFPLILLWCLWLFLPIIVALQVLKYFIFLMDV